VGIEWKKGLSLVVCTFCIVKLLLPSVVYGSDARVNAPLVDGGADEWSRVERRAIFWYGSIGENDNYTDTRVSYSPDHLIFNFQIPDKWLFFHTQPTLTTVNFADWDSISVYINTSGNNQQQVGNNSFLFQAMLNNGQERAAFERVFRGNNGAWVQQNDTQFNITTVSGVRFINNGGVNNQNTQVDQIKQAKGWRVSLTIPWSALALSGPPSEGELLDLAVVTHDRDNLSGTLSVDKSWPESFNTVSPATWNTLHIGGPSSYVAPPSTGDNMMTIRNGVNGHTVTDAMVGGSTNCGGTDTSQGGQEIDIFNAWPLLNYSDPTNFQSKLLNIHNEYDISDFPCFSKVYLKTDITGIPSGKVIKSATLTLSMFGQAGQYSYNEPLPIPTPTPPIAIRWPSRIQVSSTTGEWDRETINWNNAPMPIENISSTFVDAWTTERLAQNSEELVTLDISKAVSDAYKAGQELNIELYEPDSRFHSGKYFRNSYVNTLSKRPIIEIHWGEPTADLDGDGDSDSDDLDILLGQYRVPNTASDINGNGIVEMADALLLMKNF
jgi:hypothetical protein